MTLEELNAKGARYSDFIEDVKEYYVYWEKTGIPRVQKLLTDQIKSIGLPGWVISGDSSVSYLLQKIPLDIGTDTESESGKKLHLIDGPELRFQIVPFNSLKAIVIFPEVPDFIGSSRVHPRAIATFLPNNITPEDVINVISMFFDEVNSWIGEHWYNPGRNNGDQ